MKEKIIAIVLVLLLVGTLTGCSIEPAPKIKEGRFNFSVTYEHRGEMKTISGVYVCKYAGRSFTLEGGDFVRAWEGHIEGIEHAEEIYNSAVLICKTDDGGELFLDFSLLASHMMGEPRFADRVIEVKNGSYVPAYTSPSYWSYLEGSLLEDESLSSLSDLHPANAVIISIATRINAIAFISFFILSFSFGFIYLLC